MNALGRPALDGHLDGHLDGVWTGKKITDAVLPRNYHRLWGLECLQNLCVPRTGRSPTGKATSRARALFLVRPPKMPIYPSYGPIRPAGGP
jgi:hypothetical protein